MYDLRCGLVFYSTLEVLLGPYSVIISSHPAITMIMMQAGGYYHYTIINTLMHRPCPNHFYSTFSPPTNVSFSCKHAHCSIN